MGKGIDYYLPDPVIEERIDRLIAHMTLHFPEDPMTMTKPHFGPAAIGNTH